MSADRPLTGDELATIKAQAEAATPGPWNIYLGREWMVINDARDMGFGEHGEADAAHVQGMDPATTLRLVAEIERLQAQVARVEALLTAWDEIPDYQPSHYDRGRVDQRHMAAEELAEVLAGADVP